MTLFLYPKTKHRRTLAPRVFKHYRTYKRYLQTEFSRVCVYCRQPDSSAPNLNFGVDHYRPKSVPRFASLVCSYSNLYYCCGACNSRKNADWPFDEKAGPYVVNPCEHEMATHLRFDARTGKVEPRTPYGKHTEELLQLNEPATVKYRLGVLLTVKLFNAEIQEKKGEIAEIEKWYKEGNITVDQRDAEVAAINEELKALSETLQSHTGDLPLPPLRKVRLGS